MLKVHTDKEIVDRVYREDKRTPYGIPSEFKNFLRKGADLTIYGKLNQNELNLINDLMQGRGEALIKRDPSTVLEKQGKINNRNPYQVFFINTSDEFRKNAFKKQIKLLSGFIDDFKEVYEKLSKEPFFRVGDSQSNYQFSAWDKVLPDVCVTDVIITDPYLFDEHDGDKPIEENYYGLLEEMKRKFNLDSLIVFAPRMDVTLRNTLIADSKKILGDKVDFYLLVFDKVVEHDRYIFMNYHYINAGNSMNLFDDEGSVIAKSSSKIEVFSLCKEKNFIIAQDILRNLMEEMENLKYTKILSDRINSNLFYFLDGSQQL